jgi:hypothetical protein
MFVSGVLEKGSWCRRGIKMTGRKWKVASKWVRNGIAFSTNKVQSATDKVCNWVTGTGGLSRRQIG